jgi:hypothetical protein
VGERFQVLADAWEPHVPEESYFVFNDVHATLAFIGAGRVERAARIVARLEHYVEHGCRGTNNFRNCERVGLPICKALVAFGDRRYHDAASLLYPARGLAIELGGSAAQRDVLDRTLLEAALLGRDAALANAIASERVNFRPASPANWLKAAQAFRLRGDENRAVEAAFRSQQLLSSRNDGRRSNKEFQT